MGEVEVELEVELVEELEDDEELEELCDAAEVLELDVVVELDVLEPTGTQFSVCDVTTPVTGGRLRLEIGVPGATLGTVKV